MRWIAFSSLMCLFLTNGFVTPSHAAKDSSPLKQAINQRPAALRALADARVELTKASLEVQRLLREAANDREVDAPDLKALRMARENEKEAETYLNQLLENLRERLREADETYGSTWSRITAFRIKQKELRQDSLADPAELLELVKQIDEGEQSLAEIEEEAALENPAIQSARTAHDDATRVVQTELDLINSRRGDVNAENSQIKDAAQRVDDARKLVIEREKALAEIDSVIDANRPRPAINVGGVPDKKESNNKNKGKQKKKR